MTVLDDLRPLLGDQADRDARRAELTGLIQTSRPPRAGVTRRRGLAVALVAVTAGVVIAVAPPGGGDGSSILARASAAVNTGDDVLHVRTRYTPSGGAQSFATIVTPDKQLIGRINGLVDTWSTQRPFRYRQVEHLDPVDGGLTPPGALQQDYADGVKHIANPGQPVLKVPGEQTPQDAASLEDPPDGTSDPVALIRALLDDHRLHDAGPTTFQGKPARRLVGQISARPQHNVGPSGKPLPDSLEPPTDYVYLVDADDFHPLQVSTTQVLPARPNDPEPAARQQRVLHSQLNFEAYEKLKRTAETEALLRIAR